MGRGDGHGRGGVPRHDAEGRAMSGELMMFYGFVAVVLPLSLIFWRM